MKYKTNPNDKLQINSEWDRKDLLDSEHDNMILDLMDSKNLSEIILDFEKKYPYYKNINGEKIIGEKVKIEVDSIETELPVTTGYNNNFILGYIDLKFVYEIWGTHFLGKWSCGENSTYGEHCSSCYPNKPKEPIPFSGDERDKYYNKIEKWKKQIIRSHQGCIKCHKQGIKDKYANGALCQYSCSYQTAFIEVKPEVDNFGSLVRQINKYREKERGYTWFVYTKKCPKNVVEALESQKIYVLFEPKTSS